MEGWTSQMAKKKIDVTEENVMEQELLEEETEKAKKSAKKSSKKTKEEEEQENNEEALAAEMQAKFDEKCKALLVLAKKLLWGYNQV